MARQMQENLRVKGKKLYFGFVDLEKAFDRVPREVISWAMRKLRVEEWLLSKGFEVKVGIIIHFISDSKAHKNAASKKTEID